MPTEINFKNPTPVKSLFFPSLSKLSHSVVESCKAPVEAAEAKLADLGKAVAEKEAEHEGRVRRRQEEGGERLRAMADKSRSGFSKIVPIGIPTYAGMKAGF